MAKNLDLKEIKKTTDKLIEAGFFYQKTSLKKTDETEIAAEIYQLLGAELADLTIPIGNCSEDYFIVCDLSNATACVVMQTPVLESFKELEGEANKLVTEFIEKETTEAGPLFTQKRGIFLVYSGKEELPIPSLVVLK